MFVLLEYTCNVQTKYFSKSVYYYTYQLNDDILKYNFELVKKQARLEIIKKIM